jgi:diaminobutyrate-2-oxoglutarate transaminase
MDCCPMFISFHTVIATGVPSEKKKSPANWNVRNTCNTFSTIHIRALKNAILVEPIQGEGGTIVPRDGFLERIVEIARRHQVPIIFDEIQSGFFRSGTFFSFEQAGILPDIITLSKGLGGIGFPISAILYKKELGSWQPGDHIGTFRCNQVSIAAGNGALDFMNKHELGAHTIAMGQYLLAALQRLAGEHPYIGEVRGRGLFIGIEYVSDKSTRQPFARFVQLVRRRCLEKGLLFEVGGHHNNVIRFIPPLIIDQSIADTALHIFRQANFEAFDQVDAVEVPGLALSL